MALLNAVDDSKININRKYVSATDRVLDPFSVDAIWMYVACSRAFSFSQSVYVGVVRIRHFYRGALVAGEEGRNEMIAQADQKYMAPKRRPVFLADQQQRARILLGYGMVDAALHEIFPVHDPVVLVSDQ